MSTPHDPLWSPDPTGDAELARLEHLLHRYRHVAHAPRHWHTESPPMRRSTRRASYFLAACVLVLLAGTAAWLPWRLQWKADAPWSVTAHVESRQDTLAVGDRLITAVGERATVRVARIGTIDIAPLTRMSLLETRPGRHRVSLEQGHIRARIWAPPGYFGVLDNTAEVVDLGCEFDLWKTADGHGRLAVTNGWVMHTVAGKETLVPAGYAVSFDETRASIPLRADASKAFRMAVERLDIGMGHGTTDSEAERLVAGLATDADAYTLLSLLTRYPALARGPVYLRLARAFGIASIDARHREAWAAGSVHAINAWWDRMPRPPKQWWRNWRDLFS